MDTQCKAGPFANLLILVGPGIAAFSVSVDGTGRYSSGTTNGKSGLNSSWRYR